MTYTNVFGGTTVYPADVAYRAVLLTGNTTLEWPTELATSANVLASIMDVTPSGGVYTIRLPAANLASVGETALFFNVGAANFIVADNGGNTIVTVAPGLAWQVYLTGNATANGTWRSTQYGAGTSSATAGSLVGAGIKAIGATLNQSMPSTSLNTNYTVGANDRAGTLNWTGGAGTFTLPSAASVGADWFVNIRNSGTGAVTLSPAVGGQLVNGGASLLMNPGDSAVLFCDGAGFFTIGLGKSAAFAFDFVSIDLTGVSSPYTLSGANLNRIAYRFTGTITGNMEVIAPATVQQYWIANETSIASAAYTITVKTFAGTGVSFARGERGIAYSDGTNVIDADTSTISLPLTVAQGGTGATTASGARVNLGGTSTGIALFTAANGAAAQAALGTVTVPNGGTGVTTLTGVVKGNGTSAFTAGTVSLTTEVTGTLAVANGGTGVTTSTGTGSVVLSTSPALTTPNLGTPSAAVLTNATGLPLSTGVAGTLAVANGGTGTTTSTGTGSVVLSASPALTTPNLGTPSAATLTNATGLPLSTGVTGTLAVANGGTGGTTAATARTNLGAAASGAVTGSGLTMTTARILGRTTASTGAVEEITIGSGLSLSAGALTATGSGGTVTSVSGSGTVNGITLTGTVTSSGSLTLGGTLSNVSLTTQVTGTLPVANGGTGGTTAATARTGLGIGSMATRDVYISTSGPSGGADGDIWLQY